MRVLLISDIHGNAAALEAVAREPHDGVICLGDIVGYGPEPGACVRWVRAHARHIVQGNHDRALAEGIPPRCRPAFEWLAAALAPLGRSQLSEEELGFLRGLPSLLHETFDSRSCTLVHATPRDPLYGYLGPDSMDWTGQVDGLGPGPLLVGHTHLQFQLVSGLTHIVNPGSVGQPKDGDPRAAYAVLEQGTVSLKRAEYDIERTVTGLARSGADAEAVDTLALLLRTGRVPATGGG
jgi:predicted phosphodiesterase